jgi:hypothetical protein
LAVDEPYEEYTAALRDDCEAAGVDFAYWDLVHHSAGDVAYLDFEPGQKRLGLPFYSDEIPIGRYTVLPVGAVDVGVDKDVDVPQNTLAVDIRRQSLASMSASREGRNVTLGMTVKYYEPALDAYRPWRGNKVSLQVQTANGGWKTLAVVTTDASGKATHQQTAGTAVWRAVVHEASTVWGRTLPGRTV